MRAPHAKDDVAAAERDRPGYLVAGDALRALAALAVVVFHAEQAVAYGYGEPFRGDPAAVSPIGPVLAQGNAGVWVFFALSGYLVGGPFVRAWLRGTPAPAPGRYLVRRLRRIVPAFWVVLAVVLVRFGTYDHDASDILRLFAFAQNVGQAGIDSVLPQGWTLGCELGFYLALPLIALVVAVAGRAGVTPGPGARRTIVLGGIVLVSALSLAVRAGDDVGPLTLTTAATAWAFAPGLLLAALEDDLRPRLHGALPGRLAAGAFVVCSLGAFTYLVVAGTDTAPLTGELLRAAAGGALVVAALLWQWSTGGAPRVTRTRAVHALGRWSYGIYLVHIAVAREILRHFPSSVGIEPKLYVVAALMVPGSIAAAAMLWWLVEEPALTGRRPSWARARARATVPPHGGFQHTPSPGTSDC